MPTFTAINVLLDEVCGAGSDRDYYDALPGRGGTGV